jgi:nanoRNase/pAp phosphatase (c-di-AMP/oligoRNAs hydrolase)
MDDIKAKQKIVDKIKSSTNILVTVSKDPSVDALSAALGLTLLLDKLEKHPTAVFSGEIPPAISFLEPEKTFDSTTDSLQDFIIALDKGKADHLRYKVEGDSVRIFITPYKTTISSEDLTFSQGDFNVDLVIAMGVDNQDQLDGALASHGQILHDATIITATAGDQVSTLGGIDWHDAQASSLSEMIAGLAEALKTDKTKSLLDAPIATAFLTGIVAETDRFSNTHTTSRVMTIAAQLMAAGADQQLIASKLAETHEIGQAGSAPTETTEITTMSVPKDSLSISNKSDETLEQMNTLAMQVLLVHTLLRTKLPNQLRWRHHLGGR